MREHVNLQKKTAAGKLDEHAHAHVRLHRATHDSNYDTDEHRDAASHHDVESRNYSNSDKERELHAHIAQAHRELAAGKKTPYEQSEERKNKAAASREATRQKKERARKTDTVATTAGGHAIQNTHHVRFGGLGAELKEGPASESMKNKFAKKEWAPIETELGEHLTPEQNQDIAAHHHSQMAHHVEMAKQHSTAHQQERRSGNYDPTTNHFEEYQKHRNAAMNHQFAAHEHEAHARGVGHIERVMNDAEGENTPESRKNAAELSEQAKAIRAHSDKPEIGKTNGKSIYGYKQGSAFHQVAGKLRDSNENYAENHSKLEEAAHKHAASHYGFTHEDHVNAAKAHGEAEANVTSGADKDAHALLRRAHEAVAEKTKHMKKSHAPNVRRLG